MIGAYEPREPIGYLELARAFSEVRDDPFLPARIHPDRMSQIRVIYQDPRSPRGEGDSILAQLGAWGLIVHEFVGELIGSKENDQDALAVRYAETRVGKFYIYFSTEIISYVTRTPWRDVSLRKEPES